MDLVSKILDWKVHLHLTIAKGAFTNYVDKTRYICRTTNLNRLCRLGLTTVKEFFHTFQQGVGKWSIMDKILST